MNSVTTQAVRFYLNGDWYGRLAHNYIIISGNFGYKNSLTGTGRQGLQTVTCCHTYYPYAPYYSGTFNMVFCKDIVILIEI